MVFDQTIYVANTSTEKIYVRTTYEKWQQLKFSTEVKLLSGTATGGGFNVEKASDFTEGFTALAPHHTLKMIGSFFSAEADPGPGGDAGLAGATRLSISRNYRVPNRHSILVTPQQTLQVVRCGEPWKKRCREHCPFMIRQKKKTKQSFWQRLLGRQKPDAPPEPCPVCRRGERPPEAQPIN